MKMIAILARIDILEKEKKLFREPVDENGKSTEKPDAREKRLESRRRWRLEQVGCNPDNHTKAWTVEQHLLVKEELGRQHRANLAKTDELHRAAGEVRRKAQHAGWRAQSDALVNNFKVQDMTKRVKDEQLKKVLVARKYTHEVCDKPTRKGFYLHFAGSGLGSGFTWFIGNDEHDNYIEEFLA